MASNKPHRRKRHGGGGSGQETNSSAASGSKSQRSTSSAKGGHRRPNRSNPGSACNGAGSSYKFDHNHHGGGRRSNTDRPRAKSGSGQSSLEPKRKPLLSIPLMPLERHAGRGLNGEGVGENFVLIEGEGILSHLNSTLGYIWSKVHGSIYFHQGDVDDRLKSGDYSKKLPDIFDLGARVIFRAERQLMKNGCNFKATWVSLLEPWRSDEGEEQRFIPPQAISHEFQSWDHFAPELDDLSMGGLALLANGLGPIGAPTVGRRLSLPASAYGVKANGLDPGGQAAEVTVNVGVITNAFYEGYGFVWSETLGRVYFTRDSYCKKFPQSCNLFGSDDRPPKLKQSVRFEAVPQKEFSPSCSWRAISIRPVDKFVPAPSVRRALTEVVSVSRAWGTLKTKKMGLKIFFTLSDYHLRAPALTELVKEGQVMVVGFVQQEENNGFIYRAVHVAPSTEEDRKQEQLSSKHSRSNRCAQSPVLLDDKSYSQVVKEGKEVPEAFVAVSSVDVDKPLNLKLLHSLFPPWVDEPPPPDPRFVGKPKNARSGATGPTATARKPRTQSLCSTFDPFCRYGASLNMPSGSLRTAFYGGAGSDADILFDSRLVQDEASSDQSTPPGVGCLSLDEGFVVHQSIIADRDSVETGSSLGTSTALPFEMLSLPEERKIETVTTKNPSTLDLQNLRKTLGNLSIKISDSERNENAELINHVDSALCSADSGLAESMSLAGEYERHSMNVEMLVGEPFVRTDDTVHHVMATGATAAGLSGTAPHFVHSEQQAVSPAQQRQALCVPPEPLTTPPTKQCLQLPQVAVTSTGAWAYQEGALLSPGAAAAAAAVQQKISRQPPAVSKFNNFIPTYRQHIIASPPSGGPPVIIPFQPIHFPGHVSGVPVSAYHALSSGLPGFAALVPRPSPLVSPRAHVQEPLGSPTAGGTYSPRMGIVRPATPTPLREMVSRGTETEPMYIQCSNCRAMCRLDAKRRK